MVPLAQKGPPKRLAIFENQRFDLPEGLNVERTRRRLLQATEHFPFSVFTVDSRGLRAGSVVGVVDVGNFQLEILPKVRAGRHDGPPDFDDARFLLDILRFTGALPAAIPLDSRTSLDSPDILEVTVRAFADSLLPRLSAGLPRRYSERHELSAVLRGRPLLGELARQPPGGAVQLPVRYSPLQHDNPLSRLVLGLVQRLLRLTRSAKTSAVLRNCEMLLGATSRGELTADSVARVHLTRFEEQWSDVVDFACALVAGTAPMPVRAGGFSSVGFLFTLDDLFERVVRKSLGDLLDGAAARLAPRRAELAILQSLESGQRTLRLRPDYLFLDSRSGKRTFVADAKWKQLDPKKASFGMSPADVYQLITYLLRYRLGGGALLFPIDSWMCTSGPSQSSLAWKHRFQLDENELVRISLVGVDVEGLISRDEQRRAVAGAALRTSLQECMVEGAPTEH